MKTISQTKMKISRKDVFSPQLDNYVIGEYLQLLRNFKAGRIDKRGVRASVQGLCRGNTKLILYLHSLLPKKYQSILPFQLGTPEMIG
jgi:histone deacetylase complex regulatory component SIN3